MTNETLGKRIAELRRQRGLTQDQLAEAMNVSPQAVSKWENDLSCPDITMLPGLADYFHVTIDFLMRGEPADEVRMVPAEQRKNVDDMILKLYVLSSDGDKVKMNLPIPLVQAAITLGVQPSMLGGKDVLKDIDLESILKLVEKGLVGKLLELQSAEGDIVEITVE